MNSLINLDANASYGITDSVRERIYALFGETLNPSSIHKGGQKARALIEDARDKLRATICAPQDFQIIFTSGATEANNFILSQYQKNTVVLGSYEHSSIIEYAKERAVVSPLEHCNEDTRLASLMYANNETGKLYNVEQSAVELREKFPKIKIHSDAVQALGKLPLDLSNTAIDSFAFSAHKIGALTGVGALVVRKTIDLKPFLFGGPQENRLRAGTENVVGIASFGFACEEIYPDKSTSMRKNATFIANEIKRALPDAIFVSDHENNLPNTLSIRFPSVPANDLVVALDLRDVLISAGSACLSGKPLPSHVLLAMGFSETEAQETVRISLKAEYSLNELEYAAREIIDAVRRLG